MKHKIDLKKIEDSTNSVNGLEENIKFQLTVDQLTVDQLLSQIDNEHNEGIPENNWNNDTEDNWNNDIENNWNNEENVSWEDSNLSPSVLMQLMPQQIELLHKLTSTNDVRRIKQKNKINNNKNDIIVTCNLCNEKLFCYSRINEGKNTKIREFIR